jgi:hypothetical protein
MLCTNGHNNLASAQTCSFCGVNTFQQTNLSATALSPSGIFNGAAIASLVFGILWLYWIGSLLALIFGFMALKQIDRRHEDGKGLAVAGLVLGFVGAATWILSVVFASSALHL